MIGRHGVPTSIAQRVAFQLVFKFEAAELGDASVWSAIGDVLRQEIERLKSRVGLVDRQIVTALPKLSAVHVEEFFHELQLADRTIARTILNSALDAAQPLTAGRRYLAQYCSVTEQLMAVDPDVARTIANATFHAGVPRQQAMKHYTTFAGLMKKFQDVSDVAPMIAKAAFRAPDPFKTAEDFSAGYRGTIAGLTEAGAEPNLARTLASLSRLRGKHKPDP